MSDSSTDDDASSRRGSLERWLRERHCTEVECIIPDFSGVARGKIMPASKFWQEERLRLPEGVFVQTVTGDYPDEETTDPTEPDMLLRPDVNTIRVVPWATEPTAQVIHDCYYNDGREVDLAPRTVLKRILELYDRRGWKPVVAPELEFFLVEKNIDPDFPLKPPIGRSGRPETARQAYGIDAVNEFDPLFEDIYAYCEKMELNVDTLIHEVGAGQMEINFFHDHPLGLADEVFFFKRTIREAAMRHEMYATFMAKPMSNEPGSAMHVHQSVINKVTGKNIFSNPDGSPSQEFYWYIGGLQKYTPAAMALFAPYVNSYRRLARSTAAPINIQWGTDNRTVGIRSPVATASARRIENRVIGADANPYVAFAATLACGYLGIKNKIEPASECKGDAYLSEYQLPRSLSEALGWLADEKDLHDVLGKSFITVYSEIKEIEHDEFMKVISPWEREHLLLHV